MTSYVEGILGFPGLVSNAISQDGDALLPLLVRHRAASLWATLHTALPAIITGLIDLLVVALVSRVFTVVVGSSCKSLNSLHYTEESASLNKPEFKSCEPDVSYNP